MLNFPAFCFRIVISVLFVVKVVVKAKTKTEECKMARRGENIFKRKDGRWEARVIEERGNGERKYRSLYGKSYTEVKANMCL